MDEQRGRGESCGRAADPRRADRPGRHERAQHPLLHDQGPGAAADPSRPLGLLQPRPRRPARAGPGAAEPRLHALRDREVRRQHPRRRHPRGHRAAPHDARALAGRPARSRCRAPSSTSRAGRTLTDDDLDHPGRARHRLPRQRAAATRWPSPSSRSGWACSTSASRTEAALAAADVYAAHGRQIAKELNEVFRPGLAGLPGVRRLARHAPRGRRAAQAALDRQPGLGLRERHGRDQARGHRRAAAASAARPS